MATISITVPNPVAVRVRDAIAAYHGYDANKLPGESKDDFAQRMIRQEVKGWVVSAEAAAAAVAARAAAVAAAEAEVTLS